MSDTSSKRRQFLKVAGSLATIGAVSPAWPKAHAGAAIRDRVASPTRPVRELKNFSQIELAGSESREVNFDLMREDLGFVNAQSKRVAEPGRFEVWIAPSSTTGIPAQFTLI